MNIFLYTFFTFFLLSPVFSGPLEVIEYQSEEPGTISNKEIFKAPITETNKQRDQIKKQVFMQIISEPTVLSDSTQRLPKKDHRKDMSLGEFKNLLESGVEKGVDKIANKLSNLSNFGVNDSEEEDEAMGNDSDVIFGSANQKLLLTDKEIQLEVMRLDDRFSNEEANINTNFQQMGSLNGSDTNVSLIKEEQKIGIKKAGPFIKTEKTQQFNENFILATIVSIVLFFLYKFFAMLTKK